MSKSCIQTFVPALLLTGFLSLFCRSELYAQPDSTLIYKEKINQQLKNNPREKLFLHISKPHYVTGETLWFRIFHYSATDKKEIALSRVAYVELLDKDNQSIIQEKVRLDEGGGDGWIYLPTSMNSGLYKIVAYTNWMNNFENSFFESSEITIINPFKRLDLKSDQSENKPDLQFFPEGGDLVNGIPSKVAFKATAADGKGIDFHGAIVNETMDTISLFKPDTFGIGAFEFVPQQTMTYQALIRTSDGEQHSYSLPRVNAQGFVIRSEIGDNGYSIKVQRRNPGVQSNGERIYLAGFSGNKLNFLKSGIYTSSSLTFEISDDLLSQGINQLTVFNRHGTPLCERKIFKYPTNELVISVQSIQESYRTREPVKIDLHTADSNGEKVAADLSLSVYQSFEGLNRPQKLFRDYIWLLSDLRGHVENPGYYFSGTSDQIWKRLDNLMLSHGWSKYNLGEILQPRENPQYLPEFMDQTISGRVTVQNSDDNTSNNVFALSAPNTYANYFVSQCDSAGNIVFDTRDITGETDIIVRQRNGSGVLDLTLKSPFVTPGISSHWNNFNIPETYESFIIDQSVNMQVTNIFNNSIIDSVSLESTSFYGDPDAIYHLDDYTRFPVMEEVMREYVSGVNVRKNNGKFIFKVLDQLRNEIMDLEPLILLDGVPIFDADEIMAVNPHQIERIEVVQKKYYYGPTANNGIVAFYSYDSDVPGLELDENTIQQSYRGFQTYRSFYTPIYESQEDLENRIPDFRSQLHWDPQVITSENGSTTILFYTSDLPGQYMLTIQGKSLEGLPGTYSTMIKVE